MNFLLIIFFLIEALLAEQINTVRAAARTDAANDANNNDIRDLIKGISFRNNVIFTDCILMINNVLINNGEDLDVVMPIFNLLGYSKNYEKTTGSLWNYYRDSPARDDDDEDDDDDDNGINYYSKIKIFWL